MQTFRLSDEDAEYIRFVLDDLLNRNIQRVKYLVDFTENAHSQYSLGATTQELDNAFLNLHKESLEFLSGIRERFEPVELTGPTE